MHISKLKQRGFTLIELLVVIGILAILLAITLVALNPRQNFQQANNTQRQSDVNAILNAVNQYAAANKGQIPASITTTAKTITSTVGATNVDLCTTLVPTYMADLPIDPTTGTESPANSVCTAGGATYDTQYTIQVSATGNRVTVAAPDAELSQTISVTR
jgi:prepilin-type N-terminal cleavage/methylation domain-containing protein